MTVRLAVAGATGAVGSLVLRLLTERGFPCSELRLLASARSAGKQIEFRGRSLEVGELREGCFRDIDLVIASTPDDVAAPLVGWARESGALVVDESGYHRMLPGVPLVIPEVNPDAVMNHQGVIASPNCSTTQMVLALKPLHDAARVRRVVVSSYQATSGAGVLGQSELVESTRAALAGQESPAVTFAHPIGFNLIPQIGSHKSDGYTSEEMKMVHETRKILGDDSIQVCPTCVRVPVTNCHSESILVETERALSVAEARELFAAMPGLRVVDDLEKKQYPMPLDCDGSDDVFIGRIRRDISSSTGLAFWCVSDNLRKGAATNAVQIAELLVTRKLIPCATCV